MTCDGCGAHFPFRDGYLDLLPDFQEKVTPIQHLLQFTPAIAIYDNLWRPLGYFITSARSFPEDLNRITNMMVPTSRKMVLDLACGPGNFTRSVAQSGNGAKVIGFDLSRQMLARAVRLTRGRPEASNVAYVRGSALTLPFRPGVFDGVMCCGALQLFTDHDQALGEISRVLQVNGHFVCQTIVGPSATPFWLKMADRIMRFGYFHYEDLARRLNHRRLYVCDEESSKVSYIFRAEKVQALGVTTGQ